MFNNSISRWWTVVAGALGTGLGTGIFIIYVLGGITKQMVTDLGFDRSVLSFSVSCLLLATALGTVSLGILIHRFGVKRPTSIYLAVTAICVALIPLLPPTPLAFYLVFGILGVGGAAATALPYTVAIAGLFDRQRGLALALAIAGGGVGGTFAPQLTSYLQGQFGWRGTLWIVAAMMALPVAGLATLVRTSPALSERASPDSGASESHWSLYLSRRAFWLIALAMLAIAAGTFILAVLIPLLTDRGISPNHAATVLSAAGLMSLFARLGVGWLLDRFWAPLITALICLSAFAGVMLIAFAGTSTPLLVVGASLLGTAMGAEADLLTYLCSRYFELRAFSRVVGSMWVVWAWGGGLGTTLAGIAFRSTGSYQPAILALSGILVLAAVAILFLGPYPYPPRSSVRDPKLAAPRIAASGA